jgi:hypothetical protein
MVAGVCLASAEYCYKLETKAIARERKMSRILNPLPDSLLPTSSLVPNLSAEVEAVLQLPASRAPGTPKELRQAYVAAFPNEKIKVLDICWAAGQHYSEWKRWLRNKIKSGSTADLAFRALLTSGKKPNQYRKQARPIPWK